MFPRLNAQDLATSVFDFTSQVFFAAAMTGQYILKNPGKAMVMFLSIAEARPSEFPKAPTLLRDPFSGNNNQERPCFPEDELFVHYYVMSNVNDLKKVKYFIFPENHLSRNHQELKGHFASTLLTPNDWLLFEGIGGGGTFPCRDVCLHQDGKNLLFYEHTKYIDGKNPRCGLYFNFNNNLHCEDWDDPFLYQRAGKLLNEGNKIEKIITLLHGQIPKLKQFLSSLNTQAQTGQIMQQDIDVIFTTMIKIQENLDYVNQFFAQYNSSFPENKAKGNELQNSITLFKKTKNLDAMAKWVQQYQFFVKDFDFLVTTLKTTGLVMINEEMIRQRNDALINKPGLFASTNTRKMIFLGLDHILTPIISRVKYLVDTIQEKDPAFALRKKLENFPHAIVIPKDLKITKKRP